MVTLVIWNLKGGVGKSMISCQLAYYAALGLKKRVIFADTDFQKNSTESLTASGLPVISKNTTSKLYAEAISDVEAVPFLLIPADGALQQMERKPENHKTYVKNFKQFIDAAKDNYDICIVDARPDVCIPVQAALAAADYVIAPVEFAQEAIKGIRGVLFCIERIKSGMNPNLTFLGILPNKFKQTSPFQKKIHELIRSNYMSSVIAVDTSDGFALINDRTPIAEAQASGIPLFNYKKTSAKDAWREIKPTFDKIFELITNGGKS